MQLSVYPSPKTSFEPELKPRLGDLSLMLGLSESRRVGRGLAVLSRKKTVSRSPIRCRDDEPAWEIGA